MTVWKNVMTADERAEVESMVLDAYKGPDGTRSHREAGDLFLEQLRAAEQAGRDYPSLLMAEWAERRAASFAAELWKRRDVFQATAGKTTRTRHLKRGVARLNENGKVAWTQDSLMDLTRLEVAAALESERDHIGQARFNAGYLAQLLALIDRTGAITVGAALSAEGWERLDDYLAAAQ